MNMKPTYISTQPTIAVVMPCYNEQEVLPETYRQMRVILLDMIERKIIASDSYMCFVDDGSKDSTWDMIAKLAKDNNGLVKGIKLARNRGHQFALLAGLESVAEHCDCAISIDADLQDDVRVIEQMVLEYKKGNEVVYGVRRERPNDTWFKKSTALFFYSLMKTMGVDIVYNHADYRLASKRVLQDLTHYREVNLFLRGIFPLIGYKHAEVYYDRLERFAGKSKYPLKKMLSFAFDGITSFSVVPLRIVSVIGGGVFVISLALSLYALLGLFQGGTVPGWLSTVIPMYLIGGVQLLALGIIGEYIGKIYREVKARPRYNIENIVG